MHMKKKKLITTLVLFMSACSCIYAQQLPPLKSVVVPSPSPKAGVMQQIGITQMTVSYSRPGTRGRAKIFGGLVPYNNGKPYPWRAGADDNTVVSFEHDVTIEGKPIAAGKYGLHVIPAADNWIFAFSRNTTSWGSFTYKQEEDVLRVTVAPKPLATPQEWLVYEFTGITDSSANLTLKWADTEASVRIDVDVKKITLQSIRNELRNVNNFTWAGPFSAANWCMQNNYNLDEALTWINQAIVTNTSYNVVHTKAEILRKLGRTQEADEAYNIILQQGSYADCNSYLSNFILQKKANAMEITEKSIVRYPDLAGNIWFIAGNSYRRVRDTENALNCYNKALPLVKTEQLKQQINKAITDLKNSK